MSLTIEPLTPCIGAELHGVNLSDPLDGMVIQEIHTALMRHLVVFFRDQALTPKAQRDFAARFGRLRVAQRAAFEVNQEAAEVAVLINDRERPPNVNHYHADGIFREVPEFGAVLYGVEVPDTGGDTLFVNMQAAYDGLSPELRAYVEQRNAAHDFMKLHGSPAKARSWKGDNAARMDAMRLRLAASLRDLCSASRNIATRTRSACSASSCWSGFNSTPASGLRRCRSDRAPSSRSTLSSRWPAN